MKEYEEFRLFWGDSHTNIHGEDLNHPPLSRERLRRTMKAAEEHLDFFSIAYYPFEWYRKKGFLIESWGPRERFLEDWKLVQEAVAKANQPGKFVTFLGYEWHGNRRKYGDHNVYYLRDYEPLDGSETLPELYENLRKTEAIVILTIRDTKLEKEVKTGASSMRNSHPSWRYTQATAHPRHATRLSLLVITSLWDLESRAELSKTG